MQLHIALFSPAWPPERHSNGVVTYVQCVRKELLAHGHRVSVFTPTLDSDCNDGDVYGMEVGLGYRTLQAAKRGLGVRHSWVFDAGTLLARSLAKVHRRDRIDVIEMEESFGFAAAVKRHMRVPVVVKLHGPAFLTLIDDARTTSIARKRMVREGLALRTVDAIMSPSRATLTQTLEHYKLSPPISQHVVNPVELGSAAAIWDVARCNRRTILFVGRFDRPKGGDIVLDAFRLLLNSDADVQLVFAGADIGVADTNGNISRFEDFCTRSFSPGMRERISYLGQVRPEKVSDLRTQALLVIVASRWENQAYTVLEAMLQGCPIIAAASGGTSEIIENGVTGLLVEPGNPTALCSAMKRILDSPDEGAVLGFNARVYASKHHSAAAVVRDTLSVYHRAIDFAVKTRQ